jgi:hypothetical protein
MINRGIFTVKKVGRRFWAPITAVLALIGLAVFPTTAANGLANGVNVVTLQQVGHPTWTLADLHVFTAPIGTAADGYVEFAEQLPILLPPPHYTVYPNVGIGPGTPESPPYTHDFAVGIRNAGYEGGPIFGPSDFSNGNGVYFVYMVIPKPGTKNIGSSPDFTSGPIIPNSLFPINSVGVTYRNGTVSDANLGTISVPAVNSSAYNPPGFNVDGSSHFPVFYADNADFQVTPTHVSGLYSYSVQMRDSAGNGWNIAAYFLVV